MTPHIRSNLCAICVQGECVLEVFAGTATVLLPYLPNFTLHTTRSFAVDSQRNVPVMTPPKHIFFKVLHFGADGITATGMCTSISARWECRRTPGCCLASAATFLKKSWVHLNMAVGAKPMRSIENLRADKQ